MALTATVDALSELHNTIARSLQDVIENGEPIFSEDGETIIARKPASAAYISAAIKFLKDNDVTADLAPDSPLSGLLATLPVWAEEHETLT